MHGRNDGVPSPTLAHAVRTGPCFRWLSGAKLPTNHLVWAIVIRRIRVGLVWRFQQRTDPYVKRRFHRIFYGSAVWGESRWLGTRAVKNPLDLWVFQEIITETRPELIIETGTHSGGSGLFLASVCELLDCGRVVSIDIEPTKPSYPSHPRLTYLGGRSSTDPAVVAEVRELSAGKRTMVILDSDHAQRHVEDELKAYAPLVTEGCYAIVEDSNIGPIRPDLLPGPMQAIESFLAANDEFEVDAARERFMLTFNPRGYLRRTSTPTPASCTAVKAFYFFADTPRRRAALRSEPGSAERYVLYGLDQLAARGDVGRAQPRALTALCRRWAGSPTGWSSTALRRASGTGGDLAPALASLRPANRSDVVVATIDRMGIPLTLLARARLLRTALVYVSVGLPERLERLRGRARRPSPLGARPGRRVRRLQRA